MSPRSWKLGLPLLATIIVAGGAGAHAAHPRAVIELFTSQGCSSCPPADKLLAKLAKDPDVIALSLPVDYWDRLGWQDTLAKHVFSQRQQAYAAVRGDGQVYTPQVVVNGRQHAVASQALAIEEAVAETSAALHVPLGVERKAENILVSVGAVDGPAAQGTVVVLPVLGSREVAIGRGENARHTVTYTNIVRDIIAVADWSGKPVALSIPLARFMNYDSVVVLLQEGSIDRPGAILGAARVSLR